MTTNRSPLSLSKRKLKRLAKFVNVYDAISRAFFIGLVFFAGGLVFIFLELERAMPESNTISTQLYHITTTYTPNFSGNSLFVQLVILSVGCLFLAPFFAHLADDIEKEIEMAESQALLQFNGLKSA